MAKFVKKRNATKAMAGRPDATLNKAGGIAFRPDAKTELFLRVATLIPGEDKFYASGDETMTELRQAVGSVMLEDPEFVLKTALFARSTLHMRHAPLLMVAEYARQASLSRASSVPNPHIEKVEGPSRYVTSVIQRADEITNLIALCTQMNAEEKIWKGRIPMMVKKGVAGAFNKFDEYQFGKYGRTKGVDVTMRDAMFLTHPMAKGREQQELFDHIATNTIPIPKTWEQDIMQKGSTKEAWEEIIPHMGYMALLRNLRNISEKVSPEVIDEVAERIANPEEVAKSKQFPFRFYSAMRALDTEKDDYGMMFGRAERKKVSFETAKLISAVQTALEISATNVPRLEGRTVVFVDVSGSMNSRVSGYSSVSMRDISTLYGAVFNKVAKDTIIGVFADDFKAIYPKGKDIIPTKEHIDSIKVGGSTNAYKAFDWLNRDKIEADRVFLLSDMQHWDSRGDTWGGGGMIADKFLNWRRAYSPGAFLYSIDLTGYGTTSFPTNAEGVVTMAGWSEKIFDFATCYEMDRKTMLDAIEKMTPA